jgi:hypothetical protein
MSARGGSSSSRPMTGRANGVPSTPSRGGRRSARGRGGGKGKLDKLLEEMSASYTPPPPEAFADVEDKWIKIHMKLPMWHNLSFSQRVLESTNLYVIQQKIMERHDGTIHDLQLWKDVMLPETKLEDYSKTLREIYAFDENGPYSIKRRLKMLEEGDVMLDDSTIVKEIDELNETEGSGILTLKNIDYDYECIMYYNFEPFESDCPLLLRGPQLVDVLKDDELKKRKRDSPMLPI